MTRRIRLWTLLGILPFVLIGAIVGGTGWLGGVRLDLTEHRLYTLSQGAEAVLADLEVPVSVTVYFSDEASEGLPALRFFADRVEQLLDEMVRASNGQLTVQWIDPVPYSAAEDEALVLSLTGLPSGRSGEALYFGGVIESDTGRQETIRLLTPQREPVLEYELLSHIDRVQREQRSRVGLIMDAPYQDWLVFEEMERRYQVLDPSEPLSEWLEQLDAVVVIEPDQLESNQVDELITAMANGLPALFLLDPIIQTLSRSPQSSPGWASLLAYLGLNDPLGEFVVDRRLALEVSLNATQGPVRHPAVLGLGRVNFDQTDVMTSELDAINVASPGQLIQSPESIWEWSPLWQSSIQSARFSTARLRADMASVDDLEDWFQEIPIEGDARVLAVRLSGPTEVIIVADIDFLADRYWVTRQSFLGTELAERFADNGLFILNALDQLVGHPELIALRSRDVSYRPFDWVDDLRLSAEVRLLATEQRLEMALAEADEALAALRSRTIDELSVEEQQTLQAFVERRGILRSELREVRRGLNEDIDRLGNQLAWLNVFGLPLLITLVALCWVWVRRRRALG